MRKNDGHAIIETMRKEWMDIAPCSRWTELEECVKYHVQLACLLEAPSRFGFISYESPEERIQAKDMNFDVNIDSKRYIEMITKIVKPHGHDTLLTNCIKELHYLMKPISFTLEREGKRAFIIVVTDGLPTDMDGNEGDGDTQKLRFIGSLQSLARIFPLQIILRLCTDDKRVIRFYETSVRQFGIPIHILLDYLSEAKKVHKHNEWLNYGLALHHSLEMGLSDQIFYRLKEQPLQIHELKQFCCCLFGGKYFEGNDPETDFNEFLEMLELRMKLESNVYHPINRRMNPWIDLKKLSIIYESGMSKMQCRKFRFYCS